MWSRQSGEVVATVMQVEELSICPQHFFVRDVQILTNIRHFMRNKTLLILFLITGLTISGYCQEGKTFYNDTAFVNGILQLHNDYRSALQLPPLEWSPALAADALAWAKHLAGSD